MARLTREVRKVVEALASYDHSTNDEMGDTYCEFCDGYGPDLRNRSRPMTHQETCPVLAARRLVGEVTPDGH